ncbi:hypothetical protein [Mucilaginibacter sp.]|uniref:hypothetical protein n=1 Tax=Mucilaginibacter sp. TaxID=1882438 RepID=UPI002607DAED|nr:hypothetical protein [Mucilaginibacter sp.]MDB5031650.1 hypothetical protein [Mucilaginibacter sp.]
MKKSYSTPILILLGLFFITLSVSCKKDNTVPPANTISDPVNFAKLGLYEQIGGSTRRIFIAISQIGSQPLASPYGLVFDTGSTGMTIDANGILPASMITANGLIVAGDSVNVNGITVTSQQALITYGGVDGSVQEYGNLAYATVQLGDGHGSITTPRIPFFIYYKIVNTTTGKPLAAHSADVFGVGPGVSYTSRLIGSPLSYFKLGANITNGFRLAVLPSSGFNTTATYVPDLLYIGLTPKDLSGSNFIMHTLSYNAISGYLPNITSTVTYGGTSTSASILFDTGTPTTSIIENSAATANVANLPINTVVSFTTSQGFNYQYTVTSTANATEVENPSYSLDTRTIFSIDFFLNNEYLLDYTNHRIGLKNN